jgi:hypothetical protein
MMPRTVMCGLRDVLEHCNSDERSSKFRLTGCTANWTQKVVVDDDRIVLHDIWIGRRLPMLPGHNQAQTRMMPAGRKGKRFGA